MNLLTPHFPTVYEDYPIASTSTMVEVINLRIDKIGTVTAPCNYRNWYAEITGDTDYTTGFHLILMKERYQVNIENYNYLHFWDVSEEDVYRQLDEHYIVIDWDVYSKE